MRCVRKNGESASTVPTTWTTLARRGGLLWSDVSNPGNRAGKFWSIVSDILNMDYSYFDDLLLTGLFGGGKFDLFLIPIQRIISLNADKAKELVEPWGLQRGRKVYISSEALDKPEKLGIVDAGSANWYSERAAKSYEIVAHEFGHLMNWIYGLHKNTSGAKDHNLLLTYRLNPLRRKYGDTEELLYYECALQTLYIWNRRWY